MWSPNPGGIALERLSLQRLAELNGITCAVPHAVVDLEPIGLPALEVCTRTMTQY